MKIKRYRVIAIGAKTPDILSKVTQSLSMQNYEIDNVSSLRLGHSIVVICIIQASSSIDSIKKCLKDVVVEYGMELIIDECDAVSTKFIKSDAFLRIRGKHESGIKAYIISELIDSGLDIHGLESNTCEIDDGYQFVMNIKGQAINGLESLSISANKLTQQGINTTLATEYKLLA